MTAPVSLHRHSFGTTVRTSACTDSKKEKSRYIDRIPVCCSIVYCLSLFFLSLLAAYSF